MKPRIPFNKPYIAGTEIDYVATALASTGVAADGHFTRSCSRLLEERFAVKRVLMTPSCTAALEMAAQLCELKPGDEVILPSFTFVSAANAVVRLGARPVFVDVRVDTLNLNEAMVEDAVTPCTRAIIPVHYAGVGCEMERIGAIAKRHDLLVIEDAAQGVNAFYRGKALGTMSDLGAYSFHHTKNYISGEGGALCINSAALTDRAEIIREKGTNRAQFFRGQVDKYTWVDVGSSYVPSEIVCAFLYAQLERMDDIAGRRRNAFKFYQHHLKPLEDEGLLTLPYIPPECESNHHTFYVLLPDEIHRNKAVEFLRARGIQAVFHYVPLHTSPMGKKLGYSEGSLPVTENVSGRILRLPLFTEITEAEQAEVVEALSVFLRECVTPR